jgi:hypothetical protein
MRRLKAVVIVGCVFMLVPTAQAWNKPGHMTSAAIAYLDLKDRHPDVLAQVVEALKQHPDFDSMWADQLSDAGDQDLYLLMLAARWSDDIKEQTHEYNAWHWVNIPYRPGQSEVLIPDGDSILTAFPANRSIAKSPTDAQARAVAVCWMLHLIGDIHQPLHTATLVTDKYPEPHGDSGGNSFFVRVAPDRSPIKLHAFWDGLILGSPRFQSVRNKATALRNNPNLSRENFSAQLAVHEFKDWAVAAYTIAADQAYLKGTLQDDGAVVPPDYKAKAKATAERQIVLSGYRISDAMVDVFGR